MMTTSMSFRDRLLDTLRVIQPVLDVSGVVVVGSEVPNLLEPGAASSLVVSQDVDVAIPLAAHAEVVAVLAGIDGLSASPEEPSVWLPRRAGLIEVNFLGLDPALVDPTESYPFEHDVLPLMVFGGLTWTQRASTREIEGLRIPLPSVAGLVLEKLATDRSGLKGDRDLLVVVGLLSLMTDADLSELDRRLVALPRAVRRNMAANASLLSVLGASPGVPDPTPHRARIRDLLARVEGRA